MRAKIFTIEDSDMESQLNAWLADLPEDETIEDIRIGSGIILFLLGSSSERPRRHRAAPERGPAVCRQCRKRLAVEGKKSCEECLEYQRKYREKKKQEKDEQRYLP